jgi:hypothetical protein
MIGEPRTISFTFLRVEADVLGLLADQAVAHQLADLDHEVLALAALLLGHVVVVALEGDHAEGHVARLVLHHVPEDLLDERLLGELVHVAEGGHREPLHQDLHPEILEVPAALQEDHVEQPLQVGIDGPHPLELVAQVAREDLHVPRLVHGLGRGVVLGLHPRHGAHQLGGGEERSLLAVHELGELQRDLGVAEARLLLRIEALVGSVVLEGIDDRRDDLALGIDVGVPAKRHGPVPLLALRLLVEVPQPLLHAAVVPGVAGVEGGEEELELGVETPGPLLPSERLAPGHGLSIDTQGGLGHLPPLFRSYLA